MTELRNHQLHEDTKTTLQIASQMVDALHAGLVERIHEQQNQIDRLWAHIRELEKALEAAGMDVVTSDDVLEPSAASDTSQNLSDVTTLLTSSCSGQKAR